MTDEVRVTSSSGGQKGQKLARFDLISPIAEWALAEHLGVGAQKYEARNWERGYEWSLSVAALRRHLSAWWGGEDIDPETGHSHLDAIMFHAMALRHFTETHPEFDDRPSSARTHKQEQAARILETLHAMPPRVGYTQADRERDTVSCPDIAGRDIEPEGLDPIGRLGG